MTSRTRPSYGIDGYRFVIGLSTAALLIAALAICLAAFHHAGAAAIAGVAALLPAVPAMLGWQYVLVGKQRHRDRLLALHAWRGDERILDVGTGAGLLAIGAAKRCTRGHVVGIDIWRAQDLSSNGAERARANAVLEVVGERVEICDGDARKMSFPDASFDAVISMLCLHNIEPNAKLALEEIVRVLKPGGVAILSDLAGIQETARWFTSLGFDVECGGPAWNTFPFQRWLIATKPTR